MSHKKKLKRHKKEKKFTKQRVKPAVWGLTESFVFHTFAVNIPEVGRITCGKGMRMFDFKLYCYGDTDCTDTGTQRQSGKKIS